MVEGATEQQQQQPPRRLPPLTPVSKCEFFEKLSRERIGAQMRTEKNTGSGPNDKLRMDSADMVIRPLALSALLVLLAGVAFV